MNRFLMSVAVAVLGFATLGAAETRAEGHSGRGSGHSFSGGSRHESMGGRQFRASRGFDYDRHGYRSFSWTHSYWSSYYGCTCYYAPSYGWCFYEPSYSCYVPVSYYSEVYPEFSSATAIQQTTVVVASPGLSDGPVPPPVVPEPAAVQQTNVGAPAGPVANLPPAPAVVPAPTAVQKTKVGAGGP